MRSEILRMERVSKAFAGVEALDNLNLNVFKGEILGIVGLSNAGKSTIVKILAGIYPIDQGIIYFNEREVSIGSKRESQKMGIYYIHKDSWLIPNLSIAENIFFRDDCLRRIFLKKSATNQQARRLLTSMGLEVNTESMAGKLPLGQQHLVEIAKALSLHSRLIIIDDITELYQEKEILALKQVINHLKGRGISIIFVDHKIDEIMAVADRITIVRKGRNVATLYKDEFSKEKIRNLQVGYEFVETVARKKFQNGMEILKLCGVSTKGKLQNISFTLSAGEIIGLWDLGDSGSKELIYLLFGAIRKEAGSIRLQGQEIEINNHREAIRHGIGLISEDGLKNDLFSKMSIVDNLNFLRLSNIGNGFLINSRLQKYVAKECASLLNISYQKKDQKVGNLDKDLQQRILVYKWLLKKPYLLLMEKPTLGKDVVLKKVIYSLMDQVSRQGIAIIMTSTDIKELWSICDRICVMELGRIKCELRCDNPKDLKMLELMALGDEVRKK